MDGKVKHDVAIRGVRFRLRPAEMGDATFIVALRTDPRRSQFIHPISARIVDQEAWLERYFARPGDYYFIIERLDDGQPEGTVGLYDQDPVARCAEWGRWVVRIGSGAGLEGLWLIYRVAFEVLDLDMVYAHTIATNERALAVHASYGLAPHRHLPRFIRLGDTLHDAVEHRLTRSLWPAHEGILSTLVRARWSKSTGP